MTEREISEAAHKATRDRVGADAFRRLALRSRAASRDVSVSRHQIELSYHLCKLLGEPAAGELSRQYLRDERHQHIAMFANKAEADAFLSALIAAIWPS